MFLSIHKKLRQTLITVLKEIGQKMELVQFNFTQMIISLLRMMRFLKNMTAKEVTQDTKKIRYRITNLLI